MELGCAPFSNIFEKGTPKAQEPQAGNFQAATEPS